MPVCQPLEAQWLTERLVLAGKGRQAVCPLSRSPAGDILFSQPGTKRGRPGGDKGCQAGKAEPGQAQAEETFQASSVRRLGLVKAQWGTREGCRQRCDGVMG